MVHGYHVILGAYGYWLPNDPRGSWSDFVVKWELIRFGHASKDVKQRKLSELAPEELAAREAAKRVLKYSPVQFSGVQAQAIARGFNAACERNNYTLWACAIMPEHTHLVIARHRYKIEQVVNLLKGEATRQLIDDGIHPLAQYSSTRGRPPAVWGQHCWKVFLDNEEAIEAAIHYVEENPVREGKRKQSWSCVTPFMGLEQGWITYH
jgi:REP element-mobilizing transposase RayT